jgi:hypothetical protein
MVHQEEVAMLDAPQTFGFLLASAETSVRSNLLRYGQTNTNFPHAKLKISNPKILNCHIFHVSSGHFLQELEIV